MRLAGIVLVVLGVLSLVYQGLIYTSQEKLIDLGKVEIFATKEKKIPLPPVVSGLAILVGTALILARRRKS